MRQGNDKHRSRNSRACWRNASGVPRRRFLQQAGAAAVATLAGGCGLLRRPARARPVRFAYIADAQYADQDTAGSRFYRDSLRKMDACARDLNAEKDLAFVIHLGDFIDRGAPNFDAINERFSEIRAPRYHVLGNHDFAVRDIETVPSRYGINRRWYSFAVGNWRFIGLDTTDLSLYARPKGTALYDRAEETLQALQDREAPNAYAWNSGCSETQLSWLERELNDADRRAERAICFAHHPVFPGGNAHNLWNDEDLRTQLARHPSVAAYINGHNHAGDYGVSDGIQYVTAHGMVETGDTTSYAVVEAWPDRLEVFGREREPNRVLSLRTP